MTTPRAALAAALFDADRPGDFPDWEQYVGAFGSAGIPPWQRKADIVSAALASQGYAVTRSEPDAHPFKDEWSFQRSMSRGNPMAGKPISATQPCFTCGVPFGQHEARADCETRLCWVWRDVTATARRLVKAEDALADAHAAWPTHIGTYDQHLRVQHAAETEVVTAKAALRAVLHDPDQNVWDYLAADPEPSDV